MSPPKENRENDRAGAQGAGGSPKPASPGSSPGSAAKPQLGSSPVSPRVKFTAMLLERPEVHTGIEEIYRCWCHRQFFHDSETRDLCMLSHFREREAANAYTQFGERNVWLSRWP